MNKVSLTIKTPERGEVKRGETVPANGVSYVAAFHLESASKKNPIHLGPVIEVSITDERGNTSTLDMCNLIISDKGSGNLEVGLRRTQPVECSAETIKITGETDAGRK